MRGRPLIQNTVNQNQKTNNVIIKINKPIINIVDNHNIASSKRNYLPNILKQEIKQIKARIENSSKVLAESKRQKHSPSKQAPSDYMPINFNYASAKTQDRQFDLYRLQERDSEQWSQKSSQGTIQLPVHLEPEERNYMKDRNFKETTADNKEPSTCKTDRGLCLNQFTNSLEKMNVTKQVQTIRTARNNKSLATNKNLSKTQRFENKRQKNHNSISLPFNNQTLQVIRGSKQKDKLYKQAQSSGRVKIKLNNPNKKARSRTNTQPMQFSTRPRYHIEFPQQKQPVKQQKQIVNKREAQISDWQRLKDQLQKYQFVRKYFSESELFQIYEYLKRNHISQDRWPLFVVDEAFKKMNSKQK